MFTDLLTKLKKLDLISILVISLIIIFSLSFLIRVSTSTSKKDFNVSNKKIGIQTISKICYDIEGITECVEIKKDVYRLILINESQTNEIPTLYIKK